MLTIRRSMSEPIRHGMLEVVTKNYAPPTAMQQGLGFPGAEVAAKEGVNVLKKLWNLIQGGAAIRDAHIQAQNAAHEAMAKIIAAYQAAKASGNLDYETLNSAISGMEAVMLEFDRVVTRVGTERARQGYRELSAIADDNLRRWRAEAQGFVVESGAVPIIDPYTGAVRYQNPSILSAGVGAIGDNVLPLLAVGGGLLLLLYVGLGRGRA